MRRRHARARVGVAPEHERGDEERGLVDAADAVGDELAVDVAQGHLEEEGAGVLRRLGPGLEQGDDDGARRARLEGGVHGQREAPVLDGGRRGLLGRKRVIQRRFNVSVPRARVPGKASTLRDRSER